MFPHPVPPVAARSFSPGRSFGGWLTLVLLVLWWGGGSPTAFGQVRLTEFLTTNTGASGYVDEDGAAQGWIEVWNSSPTALVTLTNYRLVSTLKDGAERTWTFPNVRLEGDERLVVWASGKDRKVATAPLHTNFTLPPEGGSLVLQNGSGTVLTTYTDYPAQTPDVSYGRDEVETGATPAQVGFFQTPTPEGSNLMSGFGTASDVIISESSRAYTGALTVTLSLVAPDPTTEIRYTTNRAAPTASSTLYTEPLTVGATQMIRARAYQPGRLPGKIATEAYLLLNANATEFTSTMPIVAVTNFLTSPPPESKADQVAFMWIWEPVAGQPARVAEAPTFTSRVRISRRGSSTLGNPKWNLDMEIRHAYDDEEFDHALLGMPEHSDWIFHAPYNFDRSLIHNPLVFEMSNALGRYAPRHRMAEVFLDFSGTSLNFTNAASGDYFGVYNILEKIRRSGDRANVSRLDRYDNDEVRKTGGYLWKVDRADGNESFSAGGVPGNGGIGMGYYYPNGEQMKSPQRDPQEAYLTQYLNAFNTALQAGNRDPQTGWPAYLDELPTIDHHLLNVWSFNVDALRLSGYWTKPRGGRMYAGPVWDFDRALSSTDGRDSNPAIWRSTSGDLGSDYFNKASGTVSAQTPIWWHALFRDADFYQAYIDRWQALRRGAFAREAIDALIDSINANISAEAITRDLARWRQNKRSWSSSLTSPSMPASQAAEIQRIKDFLQLRANFFDTQWVGPVTASVPAGFITPGTTVSLSGPEGAVIYYTLDGSDPRPSGGAAPSAPEVLTYNEPLTLSGATHLRARAYKADHTALTGASRPPLVSKWSGLGDLRYTTDKPAAAGDLVITEISFNPLNPTAAELAEHPGWTGNTFEFLELRNVADTAIDLRGVKVTDGVTFTFQGDESFSLAPGGFVIVASDPAAFPSRYPGVAPVYGPWSGNLSNGGETLTLLAADGSAIQSLTYDDAWAAEADGGGKSLVVYDQGASAETYGTAANWRASADDGGSPAAVDPKSLGSVWAGADIGGLVTGVTLTGTVTGVAPPPTAVIAWSQTSGPGTAVFTPADAMGTAVTFSLPGVYVLKLTVTDLALSGSDEVRVLAQDTPDTWLARHPGIGTLTDDFDGDGLSNYLEYAFATDPAVSNPGAPPVFAVENGQLTVTYPRLKAPAPVVYRIEVSADLAAFTPLPSAEMTETVVSQTELVETVKVTDLTPLGSQLRRFLRVTVTDAP